GTANAIEIQLLKSMTPGRQAADRHLILSKKCQDAWLVNKADSKCSILELLSLFWLDWVGDFLLGG
ncbi:MAG: hypothetical protein VB857_05730, partial [Pirellulaceae bacterium]